MYHTLMDLLDRDDGQSVVVVKMTERDYCVVMEMKKFCEAFTVDRS